MVTPPNVTRRAQQHTSTKSRSRERSFGVVPTVVGHYADTVTGIVTLVALSVA